MARQGKGGQDGDVGATGAVRQRILIVLVATLIAGVAGFAASGLIAPRYAAETRILVESGAPGASDDGRSNANQPDTVASQVEILRSTDLLSAVAGKLDLADRLPSENDRRPALLTRLMAFAGIADTAADAPSDGRLLHLIRAHLQVHRVGQSSVIALAYQSTDNRLAADVANAIAETYLATNDSVAPAPVQDDMAELEADIASLQDRVRVAEEKVTDYRAKAGPLATGEGATRIARQLSDLASQRSRVRSEKAEAEARATMVREVLADGDASVDLSNVVQSEVLERLRDNRTKVRSDIADLSVTLLDQHPRMKGLRSQLADLDAQIKAETSQALRGLENEIRLLDLREENLTARIDTLQADSVRADRQAVELRALERAAATERDALDSALRRHQREASRPEPVASQPQARIIAAAMVPDTPYFPNRPAIAASAALAAFLLSSGVLLLRAVFVGGRLPAAGPAANPMQTGLAERSEKPAPAVPATDSAPENDSGGAVEDLAADLVKRRRDRAPAPAEHSADGQSSAIIDPEIDVEQSVSAVTGHLIAKDVRLAVIISPEGDKGSATSVMLARMLANEGCQTLLLDMTGSACPSRMMVPQSRLPGITNVLMGECSTPDAVHADRLSDAHIMPQGTADPADAMANAAELPAVIDALAHVYDIVIAECGPAGSDEVKPLVGGNHAVEMIVAAVQPGEPAVRQCLADFHAAGFDRILLMSPGAGTSPHDPDRRAG